MPVSKLDTAIRRAAADQRVTRTEARTLVKTARASGSKKPIDDIFKAIKKTDASVAANATRLILSELDQKMTRAEWVSYAQKAASPSGVWGPSSEGTTLVKRDELPAAMKKIYDRWEKSSPEDTPQVFTFDVAGKPAFLMSQYSEWGTSFGLFDAAGKSIELKADVENTQREARRIQGAYDKHFGAPDMKAWRGTVQHTEIGVIKNYRHNATQLTGRALADVMKGEVKKGADAQKKEAKKDSQTEVFKNKTDGSLLVITHARDYRGPELFSLFDKKGTPVKQFEVDI